MAPPATDELIGRVNAADPGTLEAAAGALDAAAEQMADHARLLSGIVSATLPVWKGPAAGAWLEFFTLPTANLRLAVWPLREMAAALREIAAEAERAKGMIAATQDELRAIYMNPLDLESRLRAETLIESAASSYHAAERRIRERLWRIGDLAPYPLPGPPPPPLRPARSFWDRLLGGPDPMFAYPVGPDGQPYALDEDGNPVQVHQGHPQEVEVKETGAAPLWRLIPRVARRVPANPTHAQLVKAFADDIVQSEKWATGRIYKHINEWHGRPSNLVPTPQVQKDFLDMVSKAAASKSPVYDSFLPETQTWAKLYFDQATRKPLVVHFSKESGEFASAFVPSRSRIDALLRQAATPRR
jgi:hypothetical protein